MKISIALCTYNGAAYLQEQLASIACQSRLPLELVVCDDRSSDDTLSVLREFEATAPFPVSVHVNEQRLGGTKNFEKAIGLCAGDVIALADQDDVWLPQKLALLAAEFQASPQVGAVFSDADIVDEQLQPIGLTMFEHDRLGPAEQAILRSASPFRWMLTHTFVAGMTLAFRSIYKDLISPIPTHDSYMIHDRWIVLAVGSVASVNFIQQPLVQYRQHGHQQVGAVWAGRKSGGIANSTQDTSREARAEHYRAAAASLRILLDRALAFKGGSIRAEAENALKSNLLHLEARSSMPPQRLLRLPSIGSELLSRRYWRHSRGLQSAIRDLTI